MFHFWFVGRSIQLKSQTILPIKEGNIGKYYLHILDSVSLIRIAAQNVVFIINSALRLAQNLQDRMSSLLPITHSVYYRKRCKLVREFFNDVYKTNSGRAIHKQHPLEYEQGSVVWFSCSRFSFVGRSLLKAGSTSRRNCRRVILATHCL